MSPFLRLTKKPPYDQGAFFSVLFTPLRYNHFSPQRRKVGKGSNNKKQPRLILYNLGTYLLPADSLLLSYYCCAPLSGVP